MKWIMIFLIIFTMPCVSVCAQTQNMYSEEYDISGADDLKYSLPDETREYLEKNGLNPESSDWVNKISTQNVFGHLWEFIKGGAKAPIKAGAVMIGIILISAAFPALWADGKAFAPAVFAANIAVAIGIAVPVWSTVSAAVSAVKGCGTFMLSFIPVFAGIVSISGGTATAVSMSVLLMGAAQAVVSVAGFAVLPLMGGYLGVSLCAGVSPLLSPTGIAQTVKKIAFWVLSLVSTLFVGILSIQTVVNSSADSLALRTTKFFVGTTVPVAGAALSEAVTTLTASLGLLRSSVGIYAVVALSAILLPIIAELLLWRIVLAFGSFTSELFEQGSVSKILKAVDSMLSLLIGVVLMTGAMFIISLSVVISFGKAG